VEEERVGVASMDKQALLRGALGWFQSPVLALKR
jgi:hypothetical protein